MAKKDIALILGSILLVLFSVIGSMRVLNAPDYSLATEQIVVSEDPMQSNLPDLEPIRIQYGKNTFLLQPLAEFSTSAYLVSKRRYRKGFMSKLSPWDYALAWGDVVNQLDYIEFDQIVRFCLYRIDQGAPVDESYLSSHMANTHLIPATLNIRRALAVAKRGQLVRLDGYLVNVNVSQNGERRASWNSSTSRDDTGNGACEIMYVASLQIGDRVYQ